MKHLNRYLFYKPKIRSQNILKERYKNILMVKMYNIVVVL